MGAQTSLGQELMIQRLSDMGMLVEAQRRTARLGKFRHNGLIQATPLMRHAPLNDSALL